ncbi:MAG: F0F1 ATP synthase subunit gamma [Alphaproteobacteria bacterium]
MPSLKDYRSRITSVKSTRKITSAMKMVAASKLRRAQEQAQAAQPYAERMSAVLARLSANTKGESSAPLLVGTGNDKVHLLLVVTSDRGLAGGFNANLVREAKRQIQRLIQAGKTVKIITVGRKAGDLLKRDYADKILRRFEGIGRSRLSFAEANQINALILDMFERGEFDICTLVYNRFRSVVAQIPTTKQIIPFALPEDAAATTSGGSYEFEPDAGAILDDLLPKNLAIQVFQALLDSAAGEQAARMTAMDNATRNAGDMIRKLTLDYNRARQAYITKELIEIISGAEAV